MHQPTVRIFRPLALLAALTAGAAACIAQPEVRGFDADPRIDPGTGRDLRVWPPDPLFDYEHMTLRLTVPDMAQSRIEAEQTLTLSPVGGARSSLTLDAGSRLDIRSVRVDGSEAAFTHTGDRLTIELGRSVPEGQTITVTTGYASDKPGGGGAGLTWSKDDNRTPEVDFMFHAQGQPQSNHLWFPCHDFPNERFSVELIATVPEPYEAVSNGRLLNVTRTPPAPGAEHGTATFHYRQDRAHVAYLTTLIIGRFDVVNVGGPESARPGLWMPVFGPLGSAGVLERNFASTARLVALFEEKFDEPFPFDKFANVICRDFAAGAMENSSCVTWAPFAATAPAEFVDPINAHELAHHWTGDLITCASWEHTWLNEGWASYGELMWAEEIGGREGYLTALYEKVAQERAMSRRPAPADTAMASHRYSQPFQRFMSTNNVYSKGSIVLHMLRRRLGDDIFWKGVHLYIDRHRDSQVETEDFREALEDVSGESLERFFDQWVYQPSHPQLEVDLAWNASQRSLSVTVEQTQTIDGDNPAFAFVLPLYVQYADGSSEYLSFPTQDRLSTQSFRLKARPTSVSVNPNLTVLESSSVRKPLAWWIDEARKGPTILARMDAAEHLATRPEPEAVAALQSLAADETAPAMLRAAAGRALTLADHRTDRTR